MASGGDFGAAQDAGYLHEALFAGDTADGSYGACMLARSRMFEI